MSQNTLNRLLKIIYTNMSIAIGESLREVILYGSYARGDYDNESDIDIALIVDMDRSEAEKLLRSLMSFASDFCLENDIVISLNCIPEKEFNHYKAVMPYYRNINEEGVRLSA